MRGEGRWDWNTLYNLPVHIRKFWIRKLNKKIEEQNAKIEQQTTKSKTPTNKIAKPPF